MSFNKTINFSSSNEDGCTELAALDMQPDDTVVCLTGSGSRVLDLLTGNPGRLIALDLNPAQNALLALKIAAYHALNNEEIWQYLGIVEHGDRLALHARVECHLDSVHQSYWSNNLKLVKNGLWYCGRWERALTKLALLAKLLKGKTITALFSASSLNEQKRIWQEQWEGKVWKYSLRMLAFPFLWTNVMGEPGGAFLPSRPMTEAILRERFARGAGAVLFQQSDFVSLMLRGKHLPKDALPLHVQMDYMDMVRSRLDRIEIVTGELDQLARLGINNVDAFSLSDFSSYCPQQVYDCIWQAVIDAAAPGARVCERVLLNIMDPSEYLARQINWDTDLSQQLSERDKAVIYDIRVGQINTNRETPAE
jgi:S-adenosylmethionine-diacylglycerol 3-amino-3-carboxypropyl transferase